MVLPMTGTFVVLSVDPVATLECLHDEEVTRRCHEMTAKKYVAYVDRPMHMFIPWLPYRSFEFYLVLRGIPSRSFPGCRDPHMALPITPNTSHPASRTPITVSPPLPWDECYLSIFNAFEARCSTTLSSDKPQANVDTSEMIRLQDEMDGDRLCWEDLYASQFPSGLRPLVPGGIDYSDSLLSKLNPGHAEPGSALAEAQPDALVDPVAEVVKSLLPSHKLLDTRPVVRCSYDLSTVDEIHDAQDFFQELGLLYKLERDYMERKQHDNDCGKSADDVQAGVAKPIPSDSESSPGIKTGNERRMFSFLAAWWKKAAHVVKMLVPSKLTSMFSKFSARRSRFKSQ